MNNILIVDDSPTMRRMVMASLRTLPGVSFGEASSGLEAIERLALAPVDLMILDLNMPDMHGLEVLDFLRSHQAYQHIPVIVLTTRGDETSRQDALAAGASLYLTKPFAPQALATQAHALLSSHPERA
jgi:two-component system, chemotaxis family, chemotaxis protein CheY